MDLAGLCDFCMGSGLHLRQGGLMAKFEDLTEEERKEFQSHRICPECEGPLYRTGHSTGDLHVQCFTCRMCPDCNDGE